MRLFRKKCKVNKYIEKETKITDYTFKWNLFFYTLLKGIVQIKMSENQLIKLQGLVANYKGSINRVSELQSLLINSKIMKPDSKGSESLINIINLLDNDTYDAWNSMIDVAIDLILFKDLILEESKAYVINQKKNDEKNISDKLSLEYDMSRLCMPYGQKVISSLLVYSLTNLDRKSEFILNSSNIRVKEINDKLRYLVDNYNINCNNMLLLIVDESISQSIKSNAGSDYEDRVYTMLNGNVSCLNVHSHDSKISAMEYDFTFEVNNKKVGVSAKRTLRERYKQNHEDINVLDVDYVILFTLGTDLNRDKMDSILEKNGIYIIVAHEIYESKEYLKTNKRVYSSQNISREFFEKILK